MIDYELLELVRKDSPVRSSKLKAEDGQIDRLITLERILRSVSTGHVTYYHYNTREPIGEFHVGDRVRYAASPTSKVYKTGQIVGIYRNKAEVYDGGHTGTDVVLPYRLEKL